MIITGLVFAGVAALIHVDILFLESIAWTGKKARSVLGASREEAEVMELNQGFCNLFLAVAITLGILLVALAAGLVLQARIRLSERPEPTRSRLIARTTIARSRSIIIIEFTHYL